MSVKIGTTIGGTFDDATGFPNQSHLIYAENSKVWWYFTITSTSDTAGNPGTHVVKSFVSSGPDLATATWSASTDSPNMDGDSASITSKLWHGRSLGVLYISRPFLTNKDIVHISTSVYPGKSPDAGNGISFHIRAVLTGTTITWGAFGSYSTALFNWGGGTDTDTVLISGNSMGITSDGYVVVGAAIYHAELDCSVWSTFEPDTSDVWVSGGNASGNCANGGNTVTAMSNQTNLKVGYGISGAASGVTSNQNSKINSIDSPTQVTMSNTWGNASTGGTVRWNNMSPGTNRVTSAVIDSTMPHKCTCYAFAPLEGNGMLVVYDDGTSGPPVVGGLKSCKASQTQSQGFWPSTTGGTGCIQAFTGQATDSQQWCLVGVDTTHIFLAYSGTTPSLTVRQYTDSGLGSWADLPNQPPQPFASFGGIVTSGAGVVGVTDGTDFWLFIYDSLVSSAIRYVKYTVASQQWSPSWTILESGLTTGTTKMSCFPRVAMNVTKPFPQGQIGIVMSVPNGGSFDTYVTSLNVPVAPSKVARRDSIQQRVGLC